MVSLLIWHKLLFRYYMQLIFYNINCTLSEGSILFIKGDNGVGKSTLLRCILNFLKMNLGSYLIFQKYIPLKIMYINSYVYLLHQKIYFYYNFLNICENINFLHELVFQKKYMILRF